MAYQPQPLHSCSFYGSSQMRWKLSFASATLSTRFIHNKKGTAMVELALSLPVLIIVLFGTVEFGRAYLAKNVMTQAAREGARLGATLAPWDTTIIENRVNSILVNAPIANTSITVDPLVPPQRSDPLTVTVTGDFTVLSGTVLPGFSGTVSLSSQSTFRYDR